MNVPVCLELPERSLNKQDVLMTKTIFNLFAGMMLAACIVCLCGVAGAATSVSILPSVETVTPGEEFTLNIFVRPDTQIAGIQLDLISDCSLVTIESVEEGDLFSSTGSPVMFNPGTIDSIEGTITDLNGILMMEGSTAEEGTFCTIKLTASEDTGTCQLRIENIVVGDKNGNELDAVTYDALVSISDETENSDKNNDNDDDSTIIVKQNANTDLQVNEKETTLQSAQDTAENTDTQEPVSIPEAESNTSSVSILAVTAIAFLALAYVLDRKRK